MNPCTIQTRDYHCSFIRSKKQLPPASRICIKQKCIRNPLCPTSLPRYRPRQRPQMAAALASRAASTSRTVGLLLSIAGPLSAVTAGVAVSKGIISAAAALLVLALLGAAAVVIRTLAEPAAGALPSGQQMVLMARTRRAIFPKDFTGEPLTESHVTMHTMCTHDDPGHMQR